MTAVTGDFGKSPAILFPRSLKGDYRFVGKTVVHYMFFLVCWFKFKVDLPNSLIFIPINYTKIEIKS